LEKEITILIADRNPHVRDFLRREMMAEGYRVRLVNSGREVLKWAYHQEPIDLLILDPDLPDSGEMPILEKIEDRIPILPVVVHGFVSDYGTHRTLSDTVVFVEKRGNSIDRLKQAIFELLPKSRPHKSEDSHRNREQQYKS
jgi:DNA-binding NtrC family response regulator